MPRRWWLLAVPVPFVALVVLARPVEPAAAASAYEFRFGKGTALKIASKNEFFFLARPEVGRLGDRAFLTGTNLQGSSAVLYVPVSDVVFIEEFSSVEEMRRVYKLPEPGEKSK